MMRRPCPYCGAENAEPLFQQRFSTLAGSLLSGYDVVICRACGGGYADQLPPQSEFDRYYRELSKYEYQDQSGRESALDMARYVDIAALIARHMPAPDARAVEIGCASGGLLASLRAQGVARVAGIDPSPYCAEAAARLYGIPVRAGTLSDDLTREEKCGMVVLVGVLEHVRDLQPALAGIRGLLQPGGRIYVEVPDATRFAEFLDAPFQQFSVEHVMFFSPASLERLLNANGFVRIHLERAARPDTANSTMPVIAAVFEIAEPSTTAGRDAETRPALAEYIARSTAMDAGIRAAIDRLADSREPVLVWGVGTHTARLLENSRLREADIRAFIDSNAKYQGKEMAGIPVLPPQELKRYRLPVLISSRVFQSEIVAQIRDRLRCDNELILLYPS